MSARQKIIDIGSDVFGFDISSSVPDDISNYHYGGNFLKNHGRKVAVAAVVFAVVAAITIAVTVTQKKKE